MYFRLLQYSTLGKVLYSTVMYVYTYIQTEWEEPLLDVINNYSFWLAFGVCIQQYILYYVQYYIEFYTVNTVSKFYGSWRYVCIDAAVLHVKNKPPTHIYTVIVIEGVAVVES